MTWILSFNPHVDVKVWDWSHYISVCIFGPAQLLLRLTAEAWSMFTWIMSAEYKMIYFNWAAMGLDLNSTPLLHSSLLMHQIEPEEHAWSNFNPFTSLLYSGIYSQWFFHISIFSEQTCICFDIHSTEKKMYQLRH